MDAKEKQELSKSRVRVMVTYVATLFVFVGSIVLMLIKPDKATDIFFTVLPVASGIITFWFATRGHGNRMTHDRLGSDPNEVQNKTQGNDPRPG